MRFSAVNLTFVEEVGATRQQAAAGEPKGGDRFDFTSSLVGTCSIVEAEFDRNLRVGLLLVLLLLL